MVELNQEARLVTSLDHIVDAFLCVLTVLTVTLENTVKTSNHEFATILFDCSDYEKRVLLDIVTAAKASLRENASRFVFPRR